MQHQPARPAPPRLPPAGQAADPKTHAVVRDYDAMIDAEEFMDSGSECYVDAQPALRHSVH
jgi:hypothetical protein